jgi:hypothetical protein
MDGVMSESPGAPAFPLEIDEVECSPLGREKVVVRLTGRWSTRRRAPDGQALLVVEADGRQHRFPAISEPRRVRISRPGTWAASFALPAWLEPRLAGQMSLWLGELAIPLPPISFTEGGPSAEHAQPLERETPRVPPAEPPQQGAVPPLPDRDQPPPSAWQGGEDSPFKADDAFQETVSALRTELQERAASEAHLRGVLARTQAELESRSATQGRLESTQAELRVELDQLGELLQRESTHREEVESRAVVMAAQVAGLQEQLAELSTQLGRLRGELAETVVARDAAKGEAAALRAELDRLGAELASAQQVTAGRDGGLGDAEALLAEARSLTARFTARPGSQHAEPEKNE